MRGRERRGWKKGRRNKLDNKDRTYKNKPREYKDEIQILTDREKKIKEKKNGISGHSSFLHRRGEKRRRKGRRRGEKKGEEEGKGEDGRRED